MKYDVMRLHHLRRLHRERLAAVRAAADERLDLRDKLLGLQRDHQRITHAYRPGDAGAALTEIDRRIAAIREEMASMTDRENELATANSIAGQTFQRALEFAREHGLDLPDDLKPPTFGNPVLTTTENA